jgi:hypothetical protein
MMLVTIWVHKVQVLFILSIWLLQVIDLCCACANMSNCYRSPNSFRLDKVSQTTHLVATLQWLWNLKIMELQNRPILWEPKYHEEDNFPYIHVHLQNSVPLTFSLHLSVKKAGIMLPNTYQCTIPWNLPWLHN